MGDDATRSHRTTSGRTTGGRTTDGRTTDGRTTLRRATLHRTTVGRLTVGAAVLSVVAGLLATVPALPSGAAGSASCAGTTLTIGQSLGAGGCLAAGPATLTMQADGNLVSTVATAATQRSTVVWASGTTGTGNSLVLPATRPGQAVVEGSGGTAIMTMGALDQQVGSATERLVLQTSGNVLLQTRTGTTAAWQGAWQSGTTSVPFSQLLTAGQSDWSPSDNFQLLMQATGNLVLYYQTKVGNGLAIWSTATTAHPGAYAVVQDDGNFVVYAGTGHTVLWQSATDGVPAAVLQVQDDGNVVIYGTNTAGQYAAWSTGTNGDVGSTLHVGQDLQAGQYLQSPTGQYHLVMTPGGVLALYQFNLYACPLWSAPGVTSLTSYAFTPQSGSYLNLSSSGTPGLYGPGASAGASPLWSATGAGTAGATLSLQADGNLVLYADGQAVWSTGTDAVRGSVLCTGSVLKQGQSLVAWQDSDGSGQPGSAATERLVLQDTCNLVFYDRSTVAWASDTDVNQAGTKGSSLTEAKKNNGTYNGCYLQMQADGNLVMYGGRGTAMWASNTDQSSPLPFGAKALGPYLAAPLYGGTAGNGTLYVASSHGQVLGTPRPAKTGTLSSIMSDVLDSLSLLLTFVAGPLGAVWSTVGTVAGAVSVAGNWGAFINSSVAASKSSGAHSDVVVPQPAGATSITTCSPTAPATLAAGTYLDPGGCLSADGGTVKLLMQGTGNLVLYPYGGHPTGSAGHALWASNTDAGSSLGWAYATVTAAGSLAVATSTAKAQWTSGTTANGAVLQLTDSGNVRLWSGPPGATGSVVLWQTSTGITTVTTCTPATSPSVLLTGQTMASTSCLYSPGGQYQLIMQADGNLVEYLAGKTAALWSSNTDGNGGATATVDPTDGALTVVGPGAKPLWTSTGAVHSLLSVQSTGNVVLYGSNGKVSVDAVPYAAWQSGTANRRGNELDAGQLLMPGQYLESANDQYKLTMGTSGLLELSYTTPVHPSYFCPVWTAQARHETQNGNVGPVTVVYKPALATGSFLVLQKTTGNLVLSPPTAGGSPLWSAGIGTTAHGPTDYLRLGTDGNLVVYRSTGAAVWSTGTDNDRGTALCTDAQLHATQYVTEINYNRTPTAHDRLLMQGTCNLVMYVRLGGETDPIWASTTATPTAGKGDNHLSSKHLTTYKGCYVIMQADGNLVMYGANGTAMWSSTTTQSGKAIPQLEKNLGPYSVVVVPGGETFEEVQIRTASNVILWNKPKAILATPASGDAAASAIQGIVSTLALALGLLL